jgi:hypothetical protein
LTPRTAAPKVRRDPDDGETRVRKLLIGGAAVAALLAGVAWGAWRWGASQAEARLDAQAAQLADDGVTLRWGERRVGGFPTGWTIRLTDVSATFADGAATLEAPWMEIGATFDDRETARARLSPTAVLTLDPGAGGPAERIEIASTDLILRAPVSGAGDRTLSAASVGLSMGDPAESVATVEGLEATIAAAGAGASVAATATRASVAARTPQGAGLSSASDLRLSARALGVDAPGLAAFIADGGAFEATVDMASTTSEAPGLKSEGGPTRSSVALTNGRIDYDGSAEWLRYAFAPGADGGPGGLLDVGPTTVEASLPLRAGAEPQAFALAVSIARAAPDAALWSRIDPRGALGRDDFALNLDLSGEARLPAGIAAAAESAESAEPPVRLETLEIRTLKASGGGGEATASGALRLDGPTGAPQGRLHVRLAGWEPILGALANMGIVGGEQAGLLALTLDEYNRPDAPPGVFEAEIALDGPAAFVNGRELR